MKDSEHLPILRKANEILDLVRMVTGLFPEDNQYLQMMKMQLLEDAMILPVKISGAEAVKLYDIKMENATLVRKAAKICKFPIIA